MRLILAALLAFWTPFAQAAEPSFDALSNLLHDYAGPVDEQAAVAAPEADIPPEAGVRLAKIQADLSLMAAGFEAFRHPSHARHALQDLPDHIVPELRPFFKDRDSTLDTVYRTLAVTDYTWALRFPEPTCAPRTRRKILLSSKDGLFTDVKSGGLSPWLARLLGPSTDGRTAEEALDRASSKQTLSPRDYELMRVKVAKITEALSSDKAVGKERAKLYCLRAEAYETLASAHQAVQGGLVQASRGTDVANSPDKESSSVLLIAVEEGPKRYRAVGAGVVIETTHGRKVLTVARLTSTGGEDKPSLRGFIRTKDGTLSKPYEIITERMDQGTGVLVGRLEDDKEIPALIISQVPVARQDLVRAIGHMSAGAWTVSQGLVTATGNGTFASDAILGADMLGSPLLNDAGEVVGLVVLSPQDGAPTAVMPAYLRQLTEGSSPLGASADIQFMASRQTGSGSILTAAAPIAIPASASDAGLVEASYIYSQTPYGTVRGRCMNCTDAPQSSYSSGSSGSSGGAEIGQALGQAMAPLVEALIFKGVPALFRGIGSLFKSKPRVDSPPPRSAVAQEQPRKIEKPPEPPKLTKLTLTITPDEGLEGETLSATAELEFSGDNPPKGGISVIFTADTKGKILFSNNQTTYSAMTDASGKVTINFELSAKEHDRQQPFDEMKDEERRRAGEEVPSRVSADRKPKNAFEKVKQRTPAVFDSLDNEEQKTATEEFHGGRNEPSEVESSPNTDLTNASVQVGPTPAQLLTPPTNTLVPSSFIATINMTAAATSETMGSVKGDAKVNIVAEECPPGTRAADQPDFGQPGHPPMGSPHKAMLEEQCRPLELEAEKACGQDQTCRNAKLLDLGYDFRACVNRWEMNDGGGSGNIGNPPLPRPNKLPPRCIRKRKSDGSAKTRGLTLYAQSTDTDGDGEDDQERAARKLALIRKALFFIESLIKNPDLLTGKKPEDIEPQVSAAPNWKLEKLGNGSHKGQGWLLREYHSNGQPTGRMIRWHPGGGQHGPGSYWRVTSPSGGKSGRIP